MSYIVIKVYNFECDWPGCNVTNIEVAPVPATLREAVKILRKAEHWTVKDGKQYCRKHTEG